MGRTQQRNLHFLAIVSFLLTSTSAAAGVRIRLSGSIQCSGIVEIDQNRKWKAACLDGWDFNIAQVVCRQLGCGTALSASNTSNVEAETGKSTFKNVNCSGEERSLDECLFGELRMDNCGHQHMGAVVECSEPLLPLLSSAAAGFLLLLLLVVSLIVCLVRRRRRSKHLVPTQLVSRVNNNYESDEEEDYVNVDPVNAVINYKEHAGTAGEAEDSADYEEPESSEDHDYEEATPRASFTSAPDIHFSVKKNSEEEDTDDDEADYENVSKPHRETVVDIYWKQEDIYQNIY